jgi:hypothetical protein
MAFDARLFWVEVREAAKALPEDREYFWLKSVADKSSGTTGGAMVECDRRTAATLLVRKTHVLATPSEIDTFRKVLDLASAAIAEEEIRRNGKFTPAFMEKMMNGFMHMVAQPAAPPAPVAEPTKHEKKQ